MTERGEVMEKLSDRLIRYADDPMWAAHAEVPKDLLREAAELARRFEDAPVMTIEPRDILGMGRRARLVREPL